MPRKIFLFRNTMGISLTKRKSFLLTYFWRLFSLLCASSAPLNLFFFVQCHYNNNQCLSTIIQFSFLNLLNKQCFFCFQLSEQCWINLIINKGPFVKGVKWLRNLLLSCMVSHACFLFTNLEPQNNVTFSHTIRYDEHFWFEYWRKLSFKWNFNSILIWSQFLGVNIKFSLKLCIQLFLSPHNRS